MKLKPDDVATLGKRVRERRNLNLGEARVRITVHLGTCGIASGAAPVLQTFKGLLAEADDPTLLLVESGCAGLCSREPMVTVEAEAQPPIKYVDLDPDKVRRIFREHVQGGTPVAEYVLGAGSERVL